METTTRDASSFSCVNAEVFEMKAPGFVFQRMSFFSSPSARGLRSAKRNASSTFARSLRVSRESHSSRRSSRSALCVTIERVTISFGSNESTPSAFRAVFIGSVSADMRIETFAKKRQNSWKSSSFSLFAAAAVPTAGASACANAKRTSLSCRSEGTTSKSRIIPKTSARDRSEPAAAAAAAAADSSREKKTDASLSRLRWSSRDAYAMNSVRNGPFFLGLDWSTYDFGPCLPRCVPRCTRASNCVVTRSGFCECASKRVCLALISAASTQSCSKRSNTSLPAVSGWTTDLGTGPTKGTRMPCRATDVRACAKSTSCRVIARRAR